jgi:hypothetical protein
MVEFVYKLDYSREQNLEHDAQFIMLKLREEVV